MPGAAKNVAKQIGDSMSLELLARAGVTAYGIIHILVGWAVLMAWGGSTAERLRPFRGCGPWLHSASARSRWAWLREAWLPLRSGRSVSPSGAIETERAATRKQIASGTKAVVYVALGVSAARFALGTGSSSSVQQQEATSGLLSLPAGRVMVVVAGMIIVGVGVAHFVKGVKKSFLEEIATSSMSPVARQGATRLGQIGYIAKGVAVVAVASLLTYATVTFDAQKQGLDGALQTILAQPSGKFLLTVLALGLVAFGLFAILQSRYRRM